jgi:AcrR family transcriptional regulator
MSTKAERTRGVILDAAWKLIRERGSATVRMEDVAGGAGITRQALYLHFPSRTQLLLTLVDYLSDQAGAKELFGAIQQAPTPRAKLEAAVHASVQYAPRIHEVATALDVARHSDEAAAAAWSDRMKGRRRGIRKAVIDLESELREGWTVTEAVDAIWTLISPRGYADLVIERGWAVAAYERFLLTCVLAFFREEA